MPKKVFNHLQLKSDTAAIILDGVKIVQCYARRCGVGLNSLKSLNLTNVYPNKQQEEEEEQQEQQQQQQSKT
jgi:hypothetical protein